MELGSSTINVQTVMIQIIMGVASTIFLAIPDIGPVISIIITTAATVATTPTQTSLSIAPLTVAISNLWNQLSTSFGLILTQNAKMETEILSDWGKLQATYSLTVSTGNNSLAWTPNSTANLVNSSSPGFAISIMQTLLPAQYQIYMYHDSSNSPVSDIPSYAQLIEYTGTEYLKYWIADINNWDLYPSQQTLQNDIFNNGASVFDFFHCCNGWNFVTSKAYNDNIGVVLTLTNNSPNLLTINANCNTGNVTATNCSTGSVIVSNCSTGNAIESNSFTMVPYVSALFTAYLLAADQGVCTLSLLIFDQHISTQNVVASISVNFNLGEPTANISITPSASKGYVFSSPTLYQAPGSSSVVMDCSPAAQISIYWTGSL